MRRTRNGRQTGAVREASENVGRRDMRRNRINRAPRCSKAADAAPTVRQRCHTRRRTRSAITESATPARRVRSAETPNSNAETHKRRKRTLCFYDCDVMRKRFMMT